MIHPTYTHPGVNAALLRLSQAMRRQVLAKRAVEAWERAYVFAREHNIDLIPTIRGLLNAKTILRNAEMNQFACALRLELIGRRQSS